MQQYAERFGPFCLDGNYFPRFPSISPYGFFTGAQLQHSKTRCTFCILHSALLLLFEQRVDIE
jgi:hypothetical protein